MVAPLVGAWIEILLIRAVWPGHLLSLPSWERGLKSLATLPSVVVLAVAPLVGAWIEIGERLHGEALRRVAPLVGAWIEIIKPTRTTPSCTVAPLVGAWIEIHIATNVPIAPTTSLPSWERGLK